MEKDSGFPEITVTFRHTDPSQALRQHAIDKLTHCLKKYGIADGDVHVILSVEKRDQTAEIKLHSRLFEFSGKSTTEDLYSAIDRMAETVDVQLRKQKDKHLSSKHQVEKRIEP